MQARREADAVDARVERAEKTRLEGLKPGVHRELFHHIHVNETLSGLARHHTPEIELRRLADFFDGEAKAGFSNRFLERLAGHGLHAGEARPEETVRKIRNHRIGDVSDAAASRHGLCHFSGRNVDAHAALHDRNEAFPPEAESEVVETAFVMACHLVSFSFVLRVLCVFLRTRRPGS